MTDEATAQRAYVLCATAEPHDRLTCRPRHLMEARRQLSAVAIASATGEAPASSSCGALAIGAARVGDRPPAPAAPTPTSNRPGTLNPRAAVRASELAHREHRQ